MLVMVSNAAPGRVYTSIFWPATTRLAWTPSGSCSRWTGVRCQEERCQVAGVGVHLVEFDDVPVEQNLPELRPDGPQVSGHDQGRREHGPHAHLGGHL